ALLREQVDRERRVATRGEAPGDRADRVVEAAVLVDHEDAAPGPRRRRPGTPQGPPQRAAKGGLARRNGGGLRPLAPRARARLRSAAHRLRLVRDRRREE